MGIAVITGASSGLGEEFARQLQHDPDVDEIWLVARRADLLDDLADSLTGARGLPIPMDLEDAPAVTELADRIAEAGADVRWLINNAGFAVSGPFDESDPASQLGMIDVNVRAPVQLTWAALDHMREGARIVQVASSAGFYPIPGFAVYAASKAFVIQYTVALAAELAPRGVRAVAVCPGPVETEFWSMATEGKKRAPPLLSATPRRVAATALRHARGRRWLSLPGFLARMAGLGAGVFPPRWAATVIRWFNPYK